MKTSKEAYEEYIGQYCRDIASGYCGYCIGFFEHITGCRQLLIQSLVTPGQTLQHWETILENRIDIITDENHPALRVVMPEPQEDILMGHRCRDRYTKREGIATGRLYLAYSAEQYLLERTVDSSQGWDLRDTGLTFDTSRLIDLGESDPEPLPSSSNSGGGPLHIPVNSIIA